VDFDRNHTNLQAILDDFNATHPKLQFTAESEVDNTLNDLDISIHRTPNDWKIFIYRKPTFTDTIIPYISNHPAQHKYAAIEFQYNRLHSYDLQKDEYRQEENIIHNILHNSFPINTLKLSDHRPGKQQTSQSPKHKWARFTYIGRETKYITNMFRRSSLKIAFRTNNTIQNL